MPFDGDTYDRAFDYSRLNTQQEKVRHLLLEQAQPGYLAGRWFTAEEIAQVCGLRLTAGTSARIRDLRKAKFGGYNVESRRRGDAQDGLWEYRINGMLDSQPALPFPFEAVPDEDYEG